MRYAGEVAAGLIYKAVRQQEYAYACLNRGVILRGVVAGHDTLARLKSGAAEHFQVVIGVGFAVAGVLVGRDEFKVGRLLMR